MILFGVMVHQAALWAQNFKVERMFIKVIKFGTIARSVRGRQPTMITLINIRSTLKFCAHNAA
jgi:hypothetical protein